VFSTNWNEVEESSTSVSSSTPDAVSSAVDPEYYMWYWSATKQIHSLFLVMFLLFVIIYLCIYISITIKVSIMTNHTTDKKKIETD